MITPNHPKLSVRRQCKLLDVNRNRLKKPLGKMSESDTELVRLIDEIYMECPFFGMRQIRNDLQKLGRRVGRSRIRRLMKIMGIEALCPKPSTSTPSPEHKKYPYLLRNVKVTEVDQVWCTDINYIPMPQGHCYLVAIMDWHSRAVLSWEVSNSMDVGFCLRALQRAFERTGRKPNKKICQAYARRCYGRVKRYEVGRIVGFSKRAGFYASGLLGSFCGPLPDRFIGSIGHQSSSMENCQRFLQLLASLS